MTDPTAACAYRLDDELRISAVDTAWSTFAQANEAPELVPPRPLGQPIFSYIQDATTVHLYRELYDRVRRSRRAVEFPFRCDAPALRRFLEMEINPDEASGLRVETRVVRIEAREPVALLERSVERGGELLRMCGWCKLVDVEGEWREVEAAVAALGLFDREAMPTITHGICPSCSRRMEELLG